MVSPAKRPVHFKRPFPAYGGREPYVFVCYAHQDADGVFPELIRIKALGVNVWYDEGIAPGNAWAKEIAKALDKCDAFIVFITPRSVASENCRDEIMMALDEKKPMYLIHLEETEIKKIDVGLALRVNRLHHVIRHHMDDDEYDRRLKTALQAFIPAKPALIPANPVFAEGLTIPATFLKSHQNGQKLTLHPLNSQDIPITFHAGVSFRIGRRRDAVELAAWFLPASPQNDQQTRRISSENCRLTWSDDQIWLSDENSANGTALNGQLLKHTVSTQFPLTEPSEISLAGTYFIKVQPYPAESPGGPRVNNAKNWTGWNPPAVKPRKVPTGCFSFSRNDGTDVSTHPFWLFGEASFGSATHNPIRFNSPQTAHFQGRFHYWQNHFWLENGHSNGEVKVNGVALEKAQIVPLVSGQALQIGEATYTVEVV